MAQGKGFQPVSPVVGLLLRQYVPQLVFQHSVCGLSIGLWITVPSGALRQDMSAFQAGPTGLVCRIWRGSRHEGTKSMHTIKLNMKQVPPDSGAFPRPALREKTEGMHDIGQGHGYSFYNMLHYLLKSV